MSQVKKVQLTAWEKQLVDQLAGKDPKARARVIMKLKYENELNRKGAVSEDKAMVIGD
jgi:hypothetical protein